MLVRAPASGPTTLCQGAEHAGNCWCLADTQLRASCTGTPTSGFLLHALQHLQPSSQEQDPRHPLQQPNASGPATPTVAAHAASCVRQARTGVDTSCCRLPARRCRHTHHLVRDPAVHQLRVAACAVRCLSTLLLNPTTPTTRLTTKKPSDTPRPHWQPMQPAASVKPKQAWTQANTHWDAP
jgi:hypothetical protein